MQAINLFHLTFCVDTIDAELLLSASHEMGKSQINDFIVTRLIPLHLIFIEIFIFQKCLIYSHRMCF